MENYLSWFVVMHQDDGTDTDGTASLGPGHSLVQGICLESETDNSNLPEIWLGE